MNIKKIISVLCVICFVLISASCGNTAKTSAVEDYGFINNNNMYTWVQVTSYSLDDENPHATFTEKGYRHEVYTFKDGTVISYNRFETSGAEDHKNLTQTVDYTSSYTVVNNNTIEFDGDTWTILERIIDDGNIVLKVAIDSKQKYFILEEQIDWEKSPLIEDTSAKYAKSYTYYFE